MELNWACVVCACSKKEYLCSSLQPLQLSTRLSSLQSTHTVPLCAEVAHLMAVPRRTCLTSETVPCLALHSTDPSCCYFFAYGNNWLPLKEVPPCSGVVQGRLSLGSIWVTQMTWAEGMLKHLILITTMQSCLSANKHTGQLSHMCVLKPGREKNSALVF